MLDEVVLLEQDGQLGDAAEEHGGQSGGDARKNPEENTLQHRTFLLVFKDLKTSNLNAKSKKISVTSGLHMRLTVQ